jgi:hypothetical protein
MMLPGYDLIGRAALNTGFKATQTALSGCSVRAFRVTHLS